MLGVLLALGGSSHGAHALQTPVADPFESEAPTAPQAGSYEPRAFDPPIPVAVAGYAPRLITDGVRTVDWAPKGDWIAFDRESRGGYSQLWIAKPDGSRDRCLTCDIYELRKRHSASPTWHPSGDYIVFVVERPVRGGGKPLPFASAPGGNRGSDLWVVSFDGRGYFNLTNRAERGGRVLAPRFSHEGDQLVWSERVVSGGGAWGKWSLQVGRFVAKRGVPRLLDPRTYRPGYQRGFYEAYGFTTDDRGVLFGANLDPNQPEGSLDLFILRLGKGDDFQRLTDSLDLDRFARLTPDGNNVVWASSRDLRGRPIFERWETSTDTPLDLWMMNADGSGVTRLTRFNDVTSPDYFGRVMPGSVAWSRDGNQMLVPLMPVGTGGAPGEAGGLYLIDLELVTAEANVPGLLVGSDRP